MAQVLIRPTKKTLGLAIRLLRDERKLTQEELAQRADLKQSTISIVDQGKSLDADNMGRVALALGMASSDLWMFAENLENQSGANQELSDQ